MRKTALNELLTTPRGFSDAYMQPYYSLWQAHLGIGLQSIFIAEK